MLKRKEKGGFNPAVCLCQPASTYYCQVVRDADRAHCIWSDLWREVFDICVPVWNNSWSAQREVIKKPDPVKADLGNNNQGISLNKIQPKQVWISFSDRSIFIFFLITHRFCKTSASLFPDISSTTWKFWWILWKKYKVWNILRILSLSSHILHHVAIVG